MSAQTAGRGFSAAPGASFANGLIGLSAALLLVSCTGSATQPGHPIGYNSSLAANMFSAGYEDVSSVYIEDVTARQLALAGLHNLSTIDPGVEITDSAEQISVRVGGQEAAAYRAPAHRDNEGWAKLTALAVDASRTGSSELVKAESESIYEYVFDGMISALDDYSRYAGREEAQENRASRDGFGGIGVRIQIEDNGVRVNSVMENTPAERAGLLADDLITHIDGAAAAGVAQREVIRKLRGRPNSPVRLTVSRSGAPAPLMIEVVRAHIVPQTIAYERRGNAAVLDVLGFNQTTTRNLKDKIELAFDVQGDSLSGIVLDLRDNPGGLLDQAVSVSDLFLEEGLIVSTRGRHPDSHQSFDAHRGDSARGVPLVVLINGNSASASEIVAAALQDAGRAIVVGSSSFGKGTVQTVLRLPNEGELILTWARFHAPSGYALQDRGVMPDICTNAENATISGSRFGERAYIVSGSVVRRQVTPGDSAGVEALHGYCPPGQERADLDIEVAERLLDTPGLYTEILHGRIDTAERLLQVSGTKL
ncbi:MAG: S41 family peptidase [Rhodovibrionaceae bacterium]